MVRLEQAVGNAQAAVDAAEAALSAARAEHKARQSDLNEAIWAHERVQVLKVEREREWRIATNDQQGHHGNDGVAAAQVRYRAQLARNVARTAEAQAERALAAAQAALESAGEALAEMSLEGTAADAELKAAQVEWSGTRLACDYLDERYGGDGDADGESASGDGASAKGS